MGVIVLVTAMLSLHCVDSGIIYIKTTPVHFTSTNYVILGEYGYVTETSLVFQIMSCSSAYVLLMNSDSTLYYQIIIQGWGNTKSEMSRKSGSSNVQTKSYSESGLLDCDAYKKFQVSWGNDKIELDKSVNCVWVNMISMTRHSSIPESNIKKLGIMSSTYASNQPSHWRIHTPDKTLKLNTPASSSDYFLYKFGYEIGNSVSLTFHVKVCGTITMKLLKTVADMLYKVELRSNEGTLSDNHGSSDDITGIVQDCATYRRFQFLWSGSSIVLKHSHSGSTVTASLTKQNEDIKYISFQSNSATSWTWETDATGAHFTMDSSCPETTTAKPTTTPLPTTTTTTTTSSPTTTTQPPTTTTTTQLPSTTTQPPTTTTATQLPSTTTQPPTTTTTTQLPSTTTQPLTTTTPQPTTTTTQQQPTTTTQRQTTTTQPTTTTESPLTTTETSTTTTADQTSTTINQDITTELETTILQTTVMSASAQNACCCVVFSEKDEPVDLTSVLVMKKDTSKYRRSLTSASDDRPSAAYIGYAGSGFLLFITMGIVLVDLPNLIGMIRIMKKNIQSGLSRR